MLAGANDLIAIFRWGRRLKPEALRLFGIETGKAPCHATYHYFFQTVDADGLSRALGRFAAGDGKVKHVALDGKTLKGSRQLNAKAVHILSAFVTGLSAVIARSDGKPVPTFQGSRSKQADPTADRLKVKPAFCISCSI